jgi:NADPH:quinone reductase-like Zn-dependent oxidoreductase
VYALVGLHGGSHAEFISVDQAKLARAPQTLSLADAGAVPLAGLTALQALRGKARLQRGQRVVINGASGGIGSFAIQIAKLLGCHVTAVCRTENHELVRSLGADTTIDYKVDDFTSRNEHWDVVFDVAGSHDFRDVRRVLTPRGVMVTPRPAPRELLNTALSALRSGPRCTFLITRARGHDLALLTALIDQGKLKPVVDRRFQLDELPEAHRYFESHKVRGKVVVQVASS